MGRALVIGANGGIGVAVADELARRGHELVLAARSRDALEETASRLADTQVTVETVDVTDDDALTALVAGCGPLDVAVNNVGTSHRPVPLDELAVDDLDRVLATTLRGVAMAMRCELAALVDGGALVNVASDAGTRGVPGMAAYVAAKHGVIGLTRTAALDHAHRGVRVNAVAPGPVESGGLLQAPEQAREQVAGTVPLGRLAGPDEVAGVVGWLSSAEASYVTGSVVAVDGGRTTS